MTQKRKTGSAVVGVFLIILIIIGDLITGASSSRAPVVLPVFPCDGTFNAGFGRCEEGSTSCAMSGNALCSPPSIVYATPFTTNVARSDITLTMTRLTIASQTVTSAQSYATWSMLHVESMGQTWLNMPAAQTEIFGDALGQHRIVADWGNMTQADFLVVCSVASATGSLDLQYSANLGTTWVTIPGLTVPLASCALSIPLDWGDTSSTCTTASGVGCYKPIPVAAQVQGVMLRIVGSGGGGVGDSPVFQQLYVMTHTGSSIMTLGLTCNAGADPSSLNPKTSFQMTIFCSLANAQTVTVSWKVINSNG